MGRVNIDSKVLHDYRFRRLGDLINSNEYEAIGRMVAIWEHCTEHQTYCLTAAQIDAISMFDNFSIAICDAELGETQSDGTIRIKGLVGRIEWIGKLRKNGKFGKLGGRPNKPTRVIINNPVGLETETPLTTSTSTSTSTSLNTNTIGGNPKPPLRLKFDFESLYKKYPRKEGKQKGLQGCKSQIKTQEDFTLLDEAVSRYAQHCVLHGTEPKFIKHFSTFMASWRDWTLAETGIINAIGGTNGTTGRRITQAEMVAADPEWQELRRMRKEMGIVD